MKKLTILFIIVSLAGSVSCKKMHELFGGSSMSKETADAIVLRNLELQNKLREDSIMHLQEMNMLRDQHVRELAELNKKPELQKKVKGFSVVVGSFKNSANAEDYASKIKIMGYEGSIVDGPNDYKMVTSATHSSYKKVIEAYDTARNRIVTSAWVLVMR